MPAYIFDPTFSELFLNFQAYSESITINFKDRITKLYNHEPIYFSLVPNIEINEQLKTFTDSPQFKIFTSQLDHCFFMLATFINTYNIQVTTRMEALTNDRTRQTQIEVNANRLLDRFLQRLKSDYYDNRRANLYDGGKRYLEMLSILIDQTEIKLVDRITQLKALIDEDALEKCADGCYSRLQETAENLEAIIFLDVQKWIKNFLKNQLIETIRKPISSLSDTTLTKKIADIIEVRENGHEIHCYNWLVEILSNELGFSFIKPSKDVFVVRINKNLEEPKNSNKKIKMLDIVEQGKKTYSIHYGHSVS